MNNLYIVYALTNKRTNRTYVGLTTEKGVVPIVQLHKSRPARKHIGWTKRAAEHLSYLERGNHPNALLQSDWDENNLMPEDFMFSALETLAEGTTKKEALAIEFEYMKTFPDVYNVRKIHKVPQPKVTDADRDAVVALLKAGKSGVQVAAELGISTGTVSLVKNRRIAELEAAFAQHRKAREAAGAARWAVRIVKIRAERRQATKRRRAAAKAAAELMLRALCEAMARDAVRSGERARVPGSILVKPTLRKHSQLNARVLSVFTRFVKAQATA